jgi:hypothetical protein
MIKKTTDDTGELRKFGITMAIAAGLVGGLFFYKGRDGAMFFLGAASLFLLFSLLKPTMLRLVYKGWMAVADVLGFIMTRVILSVLFYLVLTPIGVVARIMGKDFLAMKMNDHSSASASYWVTKKKADSDVSRWEKQY